MSADYEHGPYKGYDHGDWVHVTTADGFELQLSLDLLDAMFAIWSCKEAGADRRQSRVLLHRAQVGYVVEALCRLPVDCRYHGDDFGRSGFEPWGEPRCDSCKPPWWRRRALSLLSGEVEESRP